MRAAFHGRFPRGPMRSATAMERNVVEAIPAARTSRCCYACGGKDLLDGFEMEPKDAHGLGWYLCSLHARQGLCQPMRGHAAVCSTHVIVATLQPCKRLEHSLVHLEYPRLAALCTRSWKSQKHSGDRLCHQRAVLTPEPLQATAHHVSHQLVS